MGLKSYPGRAGPKEGGREAKRKESRGEGVKVGRGKGSQEEGWNKITESPVRHLFQGWFEVTSRDRSPTDQLPNLTEDRGVNFKGKT